MSKRKTTVPKAKVQKAPKKLKVTTLLATLCDKLDGVKEAINRAGTPNSPLSVLPSGPNSEILKKGLEDICVAIPSDTMLEKIATALVGIESTFDNVFASDLHELVAAAESQNEHLEEIEGQLERIADALSKK